MSRTDRIYSELIKRELQNIGRWAELNMKNGDKLKIIRTGYGPMEYPERDPQQLINERGCVIAEGSMYDIAKFINENY